MTTRGMLQTLARFFAPRVFPEDPERTRAARHLHVTLMGTVIAAVAYGIALPLVAPDLAGRLPLIAALLACLLASFALMHHGLLRAAAVLCLASAWAVLAIAAWLSGGVRSPSYAGNLVVLLNAVILLWWPGTLAFGVLAAAEGALLVVLEQRGLLPPPPATPWSGYALVVVYLALGGVTLRHTLVAAGAALHRARHEIAERARVEALLRESEERYRLISEVSSDYSFSSRLGPDGELRLNWVAGGFERVTGWSCEDYVARGGWRAALHPDDVDQDARDIAALRENRDVVTEVRTFHRDGSVRWVRVYAHPVRDAGRDMLVGIYGAVQDVTARRAADEERNRLIRELEAKNAELERFTYTVSHDLKAPLITIRGFLGLLAPRVAGMPGSARADFDRIEAAAVKMHHLLDDLLDLSRIGRVTNPPSDVPFEDIAREALGLARGRLESGGVAVRIAAPLPVVRVDRARIVEVVQNLLDNAAKFAGGRPGAAGEIGTTGREGGMAVFSVRDNGPGIPPEYRERVFGLFAKLDPATEGTGIGLALVKRIVEIHGGSIRVESAGPGPGATFRFTLPVPPAS